MSVLRAGLHRLVWNCRSSDVDLTTRSPIIRYSFAVLVTVMMLALTLVTLSIINPPSFALLLVGVALTAWIAGSGPAFLSALLSILMYDYYLLPPVYQLYFSPDNAVRLVEFGGVAILISLITHVQQRDKQEA